VQTTNTANIRKCSGKGSTFLLDEPVPTEGTVLEPPPTPERAPGNEVGVSVTSGVFSVGEGAGGCAVGPVAALHCVRGGV